MHNSLAQCLRYWSSIAVVVVLSTMLFQSYALPAESIPVRHMEGTVHGFLVLRTTEGKAIAVGDSVQVVRGDRVISRLIFHFKDGSIDDEKTEFSQRGNFRLLTDHHIQKGPSFPHPMDTFIDARSGQITVRSTDKDGKKKITTDHLDLPPDLANGLILSLVKNIPPDKPETKLPMVVETPKPRIVQLVFSPQGEEPFSIAGSRRKAMRFTVKIELGGVTGVVAPLIGKQPKRHSDLDRRWYSAGLRPGGRPTLSGGTRLEHSDDGPRLAARLTDAPVDRLAPSTADPGDPSWRS